MKQLETAEEYRVRNERRLQSKASFGEMEGFGGLPLSGKGELMSTKTWYYQPGLPSNSKYMLWLSCLFNLTLGKQLRQHSPNAYPGSGEGFQNTLAVNVQCATLATEVENPAHSKFLSALD